MEGSTERMKCPAVTAEEPLQGVAQILNPVAPVDDLEGLRRPLPQALGIEATPIAADDRDRGMRLQPLCDRGDRAFGEQINHLVARKITDHAPEASAPPPGPFIQADHPGGRQTGERPAMDDTQARPTTPREAPRVC